jgi:hypothetical protein
MIEKEQIKTIKKYRFLSYLKHGLLQLPLLPGNPLQNAVLQNLNKHFYAHTCLTNSIRK